MNSRKIIANLYDYRGNSIFNEEILFEKFIFMKFLKNGLKQTNFTIHEIDINKTLKELNKIDGLIIKSILVCDDEEILRDTYFDTLSRLCHYVEVYNTADEAFLHFQEEPERYDIIMTDNLMPESTLTGGMFAKKVKEISNKVKVNIITGETSSVDSDVFDYNVANTISKPLNEYTFAITIGKGKSNPSDKESSNIIDFNEMRMKLNKPYSINENDISIIKPKVV